MAVSTQPLVVAPRLLRAVAECTQAYGPFLEGPAYHVLQEYFADPGMVDSIYLCIIDRALTQPISWGVVEKAVMLLKRCIARYPPSAQLLRQLRGFCRTCLASKENLSRGLRMSLVYLDAMIVKHCKDQSCDATPRVENEGAHTRGAVSEPALPAPGGVPNGGASSRLGSAPALSASNLDGEPVSMAANQNPFPSEDAKQAEDVILFNIAKVELEGSAIQQAAPPPLLLYLTSAVQALLQREGEAGRERESLEEVVREAALFRDEVRVVAGVQQLQARQAAFQADPARGARPWPARGTPLFQWKPYWQQEALQLSEREVAAVVEAVCGSSPMLTLGSPMGGLSGADGSRPGSAAQQHLQMCAAILIKLVIDMWLRAGPDTSRPLFLLMLRGALSNERAEVRARAFDIIFNLSLHSQLLVSSDQPLSGERPSSGPGVGPGASWPRLEPRRIPTGEASNEGPPPSAFRLQDWLLTILLECLLTISEKQERSEKVWRAAMGALLHLTSIAGQPSSQLTSLLPPQPLASLLDCSLRCFWPDQVHSHLVRITANALLPQQGGGGREEGMDPTKVKGFGGEGMLMRQFRAARCLESKQNLLAILLACIFARKGLAQMQKGQEDVMARSLLLNQHSVDVLHAFCAVGETGLRDFVMSAVLPAVSSQVTAEDESVRNAVSIALEGLEEVVLQEVCAELPKEHWEAAQQTFSYASKRRSPETEAEVPWARLGDLLCSPNQVAACIGASWLLRLLSVAAHHSLYSTGPPHAALPSTREGNLPSSGEGGYEDQMRLAQLLQGVMQRASPQADTGIRLVEVVRRFLLLLGFQALPRQKAGPQEGSPEGGQEVRAVQSAVHKVERGTSSREAEAASPAVVQEGPSSQASSPSQQASPGVAKLSAELTPQQTGTSGEDDSCESEGESPSRSSTLQKSASTRGTAESSAASSETTASAVGTSPASQGRQLPSASPASSRGASTNRGLSFAIIACHTSGREGRFLKCLACFSNIYASGPSQGTGDLRSLPPAVLDSFPPVQHGDPFPRLVSCQPAFRGQNSSISFRAIFSG
eukprot:jgi/Botrbrau1/299/Bobra.0022s0265.1